LNINALRSRKTLFDAMAMWKALSDTFEIAYFQLPGVTLRATGADSRVGRILLAAFAHLRVPEDSAQGPVFDWRLTDIPEAAGRGLGLPDHSQYGRFDMTPCGDLQIEWRGPVVTVFRPEARQISTFCMSGKRIRGDQSAKPLLRFLFSMLEPHGMYLAHAALIGRPDVGLLVTGKGGVGKSTIAAACASHGATFAGDDFVAISHCAGQWWGHSLFSTIMLFHDQAQKFPMLTDAERNCELDDTRKAVLSLAEKHNVFLTRHMRIDAAARPDVVACSASSLRTVRKCEVGLALAPHSTFASPSRSPKQTEFLLDLAADLPSLVFCSGSDLEHTVTPLRDRYDF